MNRKEVLESVKTDDGNAFLREVKYVSGTKPIIIKDLIAVEEAVVSNASQMLENFKPRYNSTVVNNLRENDFDIVGISNMDQFAMGSTSLTSYFGAVKHPFKEGYLPGGSSGGSAYLVAKKIVDIALGSDTGGSVRQPAALCGIYGLKPTYGLISRYGVYSFASSFDTVGIFANKVEDIAQTLNVLATSCDYDQTNYVPEGFDALSSINQDVSNFKIGIMNEWLDEDINPEVRKNILKQVYKLKELGCEIVNVNVENTNRSFELYMMLAYSEASSNLNRYDGIRYGYQTEQKDGDYKKVRDALGLEVRKRLVIGTYMTSSSNSKLYYEHSQKVRQKMTDDFVELFDKIDVLIAPTTPGIARKKDEADTPEYEALSDKFTIPANLAGIPSLNVPCDPTQDGFPVGMQIMANKYNEHKIIQVAKKLEEINE